MDLFTSAIYNSYRDVTWDGATSNMLIRNIKLKSVTFWRRYFTASHEVRSDPFYIAVHIIFYVLFSIEINKGLGFIECLYRYVHVGADVIQRKVYLNINLQLNPKCNVLLQYAY